MTSSPVCQRTVWRWCYIEPVGGARVRRRRRRRCVSGGGIGGAQRRVQLLQSIATRRCCRLVARHRHLKCRTSGEMFLGRTKQIVAEGRKWIDAYMSEQTSITFIILYNQIFSQCLSGGFMS